VNLGSLPSSLIGLSSAGSQLRLNFSIVCTAVVRANPMFDAVVLFAVSPLTRTLPHKCLERARGLLYQGFSLSANYLSLDFLSRSSEMDTHDPPLPVREDLGFFS